MPPELGDLNLIALDLSNNQVMGSIPAQLALLDDALHTLQVLGLSGNHLEGEVPAETTRLPEGVLDIRTIAWSRLKPASTLSWTRAQIGDALWNSLQKLSAAYHQLAMGGGFEVVLTVSSRSGLPWNGRVNLNGGVWSQDRAWQLDGVEITGQSSFESIWKPGHQADGTEFGCFFREVLLTVSSSPAICCASWIFSGFSAIKHV